MKAMKTGNETMTKTAAPAAAKARAHRMRERAGSLSRKALSIVMSAILVVGLSPLTKASAGGQASAQTSQDQLPSGTYWYNGDMSFTTIDASNGFTSGAWDAYRDTGKDGSGNALGIAGSFHLVAFDTLNSSSHIYGNILANHVRSIADYGVKPEFANIYGHGTCSYIQDYQAYNNRFGEQSYANQAIVFGSNTDTFSLTSYQNNGHDTIKFLNSVNSPWGSEVTFPRTIAQDLDTQSAPFIDMNAVKAETASLSASLSQHATDGATYDFSDQNRKSISYTKGSGCAYLTLPLSALTQNGNPLYIKGLPLDGSAALVINVDCGGADAPIPDQVWLEAGNGQNAGLGENDADTGYVLWNFTNAKTVTSMGMVSSILAPGATINLKGNSCGTFIGDNINVSGETHTRPFHGKFEEKEQPKPETTSVSVSKQWLDSKGGAEAADVVAAHGGVQAQLLANGTASGDAVELNAGNGWSFTWTDLPVKDEAGNAIAYTVQEVSSPSGYDSSVTGEGNAFTIVNKHKPETSISAVKTWNDNDNIDRIRPDSVVAHIMRTYEGASGLEEVGTLTLSAENGWAASKAGLPTENVDGKKYTYSLQEDSVTGYTGEVKSSSSVDGNGNVAYSFELVNKHAASKIAVSVAKTWDDNGDQDGIRPASIKVSLLRTEGADGAATVVRELELTAAGGWQASVSDLPVWGPNGKYSYSVSEAEVPGYASSVKASADASGNYTFALTNKHVAETTSVGVTKTWDDGNDADGLRPASVEVELVADGVATGRKATLSANSGWSFTWDNLAKKAGGKEIAYSVREVNVPEGYASSAAVSKSAEGAFAVKLTNKHEQAKTSVFVEKKWNDADDQDGLRPVSVEVQLYRSVDGSDPVEMKGYKVTLDEGGNWQASWTGLPANEAGKAIEYTVKEANTSSGYTCSISKNVAGSGFAYTLTNTHEAGKTSVKVAKEWDDDGDQDGIRPASVVVELVANGKATGKTLTLNAGNKWAASWSNLDKKANGSDIVYTVAEVKVDGYVATVAGDAATGFTITNAHAPETTSIKVTKAWADNDDHDGLRPASVEVELVADGVATGKTMTLNAGNGWTGSFDGLAKKADGKDVAYSVRENTTVPGYTTEVDGDAADGFTVTNTHATAETSISVAKVWDDAGNQDGKRPASVQVQLYANGEKSGDAVTLDDANKWSYTWSNLAKLKDGKAIEYTVGELAVDGYETEVAGDAVKGFTITNRHAAEVTAINVAKVWADGDDQDGLRPESVTAQLMADGDVVATAVLDAACDWSHQWENLPVYQDGKKIEYTVSEPSLPEGYKAEVAGDAANGFTIKNVHEAADTSVSVTKAWSDAGDQDGVRPTSVAVQLYANGAPVGDPVKLTADKGWKHTWDKLDKFAGGSEIEYTVAELDVPAGYTSVVSGTAAGGFTITNTHVAKTTGVSVKKVWDDGGDQDGIRPASVTAELLANGEVAGTVELSAANNWMHAWSDLPVYKNGKEIAYSVREAEVPEGYTSSVTGNVANGFVIANTHAAAETSVSVHKEWKDAEGNDQPGVHPAVTAQLYRAVAGGEPEAMAGYTVTLDAEHGWAATWANLPARSCGKDVTYSVREADVPAGYQSAVAPDGEGGFAFTMTNTAEKRVGVSVTKAWDDADDADGIRPASVTAQLCTVDAQGNPVAVAGKAVELSAANGWTYTWDDLASVDAEGNAISYTVQEANVPEGYRGSISGGKVEGGDFSFTMTNAHELKTVGIDVSKAWNDDGDVDGLRPANVVVELCYVNAAGETVAVEGAEQKVLDEDNGWSAGWTGLVANKAGKAVKYTVREVEVPEGYTSSVSGLDNGDGTYSFKLTNTHEVEVAEFSLGGYSVQSITAPVPEADKVCYVDPKVNKVLVGRTLEEGEFNFQLIDKATGAVVSETGNDRFGMVDFDRANNLADEGMEPCCLKFTSPGTYTYEVREAPGVKDPTVEYSAERIEFVVTVENVDGKLKATDMRYNRYEDASATVAEQLPADVHPTITNKVKAIELGLFKTDAETGEAVPGATYGLYRADAASVDGSVLVAKATSGTDGHMTFTTTGGSENIETGVEYWFEEISAPQGYERSLDQTQRFHIERVGTGPDSAYKLVYADGSESQCYSVGTVVEYGDGKSGVADKKLSAAIAKVNSARAGLAGAKLGVRPADGTDPVDEWESNGAGHVLSGLTADTRYVLYEAEAPNGFEKAADVTFTVDDLGAITLVDGAWNGSALNSYASDGTLSLVDYTHTEIVDKKVQQREQAKTTAKKGSLTQTGDHAPVLPLVAGAVVALGVLIAAGVALRRSRKR